MNTQYVAYCKRKRYQDVSIKTQITPMRFCLISVIAWCHLFNHNLIIIIIIHCFCLAPFSEPKVVTNLCTATLGFEKGAKETQLIIIIRFSRRRRKGISYLRCPALAYKRLRYIKRFSMGQNSSWKIEILAYIISMMNKWQQMFSVTKKWFWIVIFWNYELVKEWNIKFHPQILIDLLPKLCFNPPILFFSLFIRKNTPLLCFPYLLLCLCAPSLSRVCWLFRPSEHFIPKELLSVCPIYVPFHYFCLCACTCPPLLEQSCKEGSALSVWFLNKFQDSCIWIILWSFGKIKIAEFNSDVYYETQSSEMVIYEVENEGIDAGESGWGNSSRRNVLVRKEDAEEDDTVKKIDRAKCSWENQD